MVGGFFLSEVVNDSNVVEAAWINVFAPVDSKGGAGSSAFLGGTSALGGYSHLWKLLNNSVGDGNIPATWTFWSGFMAFIAERHSLNDELKAPSKGLLFAKFVPNWSFSGV